MPDNHAKKPLRWYDQPQVQVSSARADAYSDGLTLKTAATGSTAHLTAIVGDPNMPESKWLAACTLAQDEPLIKTDSRLKKSMASVGTFSACFCLLSTMFFCYPISLFVGGEVMGLWGSMDPNIYLRQLSGGDSAGIFISIFSFMSFLACFLTDEPITKKLASGLGLFAVVSIAAGFGYSYLGPIGMLLGLGCGLGTIALNYLASMVRDALPKTFTAQQVLHSSLKLVWVPAVFIVWSIWHVASGTYHSTGSYSPADITGLFWDCVGLLYCAGLTGFALARASKSKSIKACATLAALFQAPLLMGLLFSAVVATCATLGLHTASMSPFGEVYGTVFDPTWQTFGALKAIGLFMVVPLTTALAILGAYAGVTVNRARSAR